MESGALFGGLAMIRINTDTAGTFTLRVWLVDEAIRSSNRLEMQFKVSYAGMYVSGIYQRLMFVVLGLKA